MQVEVERTELREQKQRIEAEREKVKSALGASEERGAALKVRRRAPSLPCSRWKAWRMVKQ